MKKNASWFILSLLLLSLLPSGRFITKAGAADKVQYGGTLTYLDQVPGLDPISWDIADWVWKHPYDTGFYMEHLMMGDLRKGPRGSKEYSFTAKSWIPPTIQRGELLEKWEVKKNPMQLILSLRKGVLWQNKPGVMKARELTADDVVYSLNRLKNARRAIPDYMDYIGKIETPDKYTVIINMTEWVIDWPYRIGWGGYGAIQAPEQEKAPGGPRKWENACGTGPYMLTDYKESHSQTYTKNPRYWDSEIIGGKKYQLPFTDKVVMMIIRDEATQLASLRTGKIDLMMIMNTKNVAELKQSCPQLQWSKYLYPGNFSMAMRLDQKPFNDIRVRRALNLAINKNEIIESFFKGNAELHTYPFPPTFKEVYTPLEKLPPTARELYSFNPEKAKKLLAEAGYPNGFTFKAQISNGSQTASDLAAMVVSYLAKIGVTLELEPMDYPSWLSRMTKKNHSPGLFFANDFGTPFSGIRKNFMTGQTWNPHMMSDPYLDKTFDETMNNPKLSDKQGFEVMKKLAVYALEQVPCLLLPSAYVYATWWPWVKNYYGEMCVGSHRSAPIIARIWIDQDLKKKMGY